MQSISDQLKSLNIGNAKLTNGLKYEDMLKREVNRLKKYIQDEIDIMYSSYTPKEYIRTYQFQRSLFVDDAIDIDVTGSKLTMYIKFNDTLAYHNSLWNGSDGYLPILWSAGWKWKDQSNPRERFTFWNGNNFLQNAIDKFNNDNPLGLIINIEKY